MSTRLILVRHGETYASVDRRFAGSTDVELTEHGHDQARAVAKRLRPVRIDALYVSPLRRCVQTAEAVTETTGLKPRIAEAIRECDFGAWEGLSAMEVIERDGERFQEWLTDDTHEPPDGESWGSVSRRVWSWWEEVSERYKDRTVLAVTHGGPILCMLRRTLDAPHSAIYVLEIDTASVSLLQTRGTLLRARTINDTSHLRDPLRDGPPPEEMPP